MHSIQMLCITTYRDEMKDDESLEELYLREIEILKNAHEGEDYLKVVVLSPQLIVQIIDVLAFYSQEWIERKTYSKFSEEDNEVYRLAGKLQKKESDRSYIVGALLGLYESAVWDIPSGKVEFVKYFTKLDDLVSLRNTYSHEYYTNKVSKNRAKNCSKAGIELAELFAQQFENA